MHKLVVRTGVIRNLLFAFIFMTPAILEYVQGSEQIFSYINILRIAISVLVLYGYLRQNKSDLFISSLALLSLYMGIITIINSGSIRHYAQFVITTLICTIWTKTYIDEDYWWDSIYYYFLVMCILNAASMIIFPKGIIQAAKEGQYLLDSVWLLGTSNFATPFCLFGVFVFWYAFRYKKKKLSLIGIICDLYIVLKGSAATAILVVVIIVIGYLIIFALSKLNFEVNVNIKLLAIIVAVLFVLIVIGNRTGLFSYIIVNILGKDLTLTKRTLVWKRALDHIYLHPIFGIGIQENPYMYRVLGVSHCHNYYLNIVFNGGIIAGAIWILAVGKAISRSNRFRLRSINKEINICFFGFLIAFLAESYNNRYLVPFYILMAIVYYCDEIPLVEGDQIDD